ncbi:alpha amylase catalytic region [Truepera radiovictrix DSM 17093]|uniref:Alpha amylase catalytic region n=2 Tax=Truepera TaxID=332248 RepID=D7CUK5_TRURR|nr:alpha amylase catalytic region [Truepera radiovictrix DSM 17093]
MVEFTLFAPYNEEAALIAEFTDWEPLAMTRGEDGVFRVQVPLADGTYRYKFRVRSKSWFFEEGAWVDVVDPYATAIDHEGGENGVVRVRGGERYVDDYAWQHDEAHLPPDHALAIYELHVADFSGGEDDAHERGDFRHVEEKLDYLQELGVNALELMPVQAYPGDHSWGYNPRHFFAVHPGYGTSEDLKRLVDACHGRGMRVILDMVLNHSESESPLTQIDHDYWYHHEPTDPNNTWGPEFNYEKYDESLGTFPARKFAGDLVRFWVEEYHIDGIRFDAAKHIASHDFMTWVVGEAKRAAGVKPFYTIAEHIPEVPEIVGQEGPMDGCWHNGFYHGITAHLKGERFDLDELKGLLDGRRKGFTGPTALVNYIASHDHGHLMAVLAEAGIHDAEAFRRAKLGAALTFTALGVPMLWMGSEFGEYKKKQLEEAKIDWPLLANEANRGLFAYHQGLVALRKEQGALQTENLEFIHENDEARVLAFKRWDEGGSQVVVVANLSDQHHASYCVPGLGSGTWHEWTKDYDTDVAGELTLELGPWEAQVFVKR